MITPSKYYAIKEKYHGRFSHHVVLPSETGKRRVNKPKGKRVRL